MKEERAVSKQAEVPPNKPPKRLPIWLRGLLLDLCPLLVYAVLYFQLKRLNPDAAIFTSTAVFTVLTVLIALYTKISTGRIPHILVLSTIVIVTTTLLAALSHNPVYIYVKPTIIYVILGTTLLVSIWLKKNIFKPIFGHLFYFSDKAWDILGYRWTAFFFIMATKNEIIWRNFSESTWLTVNLFGGLIILAFAACQIPFIRKNRNPPVNRT